LGLLVLAIAAAIALVAIPTWLLHRHYDVALQEYGDRLERFRRIASTRTEVARQLEMMRTKDSRRFFLRSGATAFSGAEATEIVRGVIEQNGGRLISMQAPVPRDEGRYRQITLSVAFTANIVSLRKIVNAIEGNTPFLFVDNMMVRSQVQSNFRPAPGAEPEMYVTLDVSGYSQATP
jgi:hypothetical protein